MLSIEFHYRPSVRRGVKEGKVFIRLIYARKTGSITLPYPIHEEDWQVYSSRLKDVSSFSLLSETEHLLLKEKERLFSIANELKRNGFLQLVIS